jgi:gp32 DNA binding protein like
MSTAKERLAALRGAFGDNQQGGPREQFTNKYYPFWNMKAGQRAVIRFLPDRDESNPRMFMVEKVSHNLTINGQKKTVPCLSMYGEDCPVCKVSQDYYKVNDKINGKKYWRKKQYVAQALIVEDPLPADGETGETHQGQVRHIALGYQLYNIIKEAFASEDDPLDDAPQSLDGGYDFIIKKTEQGEYSTYTMGSKFHSKQRALSEEELAIAEEGMIELATLLPKNPGVEKVYAMLNADLNGEDYQDDKRGGSAPAGDDEDEPAPRAKPAASRPAPAKAAEDDEPPFEPTPKAAPKAPVKAAAAAEDFNDVDDMLAAIQARRKAAAAAK